MTDHGVAQIRAVGKNLTDHDIRHILASPYSRTLETAEIIADRLGLSVTVDPLVRERAYFTCDIGSPRSHLMTRWPHFEFGDMAERWWPELETDAELLDRCTRFRSLSKTLKDWRQLLIVTHWGFIRGLTGQEVTNAAVLSYDPTAL